MSPQPAAEQGPQRYPWAQPAHLRTPLITDLDPALAECWCALDGGTAPGDRDVMYPAGHVERPHRAARTPRQSARSGRLDNASERHTAVACPAPAEPFPSPTTRDQGPVRLCARHRPNHKRQDHRRRLVPTTSFNQIIQGTRNQRTHGRAKRAEQLRRWPSRGDDCRPGGPVGPQPGQVRRVRHVVKYDQPRAFGGL